MSELPEGWTEAEIGDLAVDSKRIAYGVLKPGVVDPTGVPMLRVTDIRTNVVDVSSVLMITKKLDQEFARTRLSGGEILVSIQGTVGRVAVVPSGLRGANVSRTLAVVPVGPACLPSFLRAVLLAPQGQTAMSDETGGSTRASLNLGDLRKIRLPLPPLNEQKRIVAKIDALTEKSREAREALADVPELLDKLRQSILAAAFRGDLTKKWREQNPDVEPATVLLERIRAERRKKWQEADLAKFKAKGKVPTDKKRKAKYVEPEPAAADGLPELPEGWCWTTVEELLFPTIDGLIKQGWSPQCLPHPQQCEDDWAVIKTTAIQRLEFRRQENKQLPEHLQPRPDMTIREGDILMTRAGPRVRVGIPCRADADEPRLMLCDKAYLLRFSGGFVDSRWFVGVLNAPQERERIEQMKSGGSENGMNLTHERLLGLPVPLPPLAEQRAIAKLVEKSGAWTKETEGHGDVVRRALEHLDSSILAKAFRGELVPQDPSDEPASVLLDRIRADREAGRRAKPLPSARRRPRSD